MKTTYFSALARPCASTPGSPFLFRAVLVFLASAALFVATPARGQTPTPTPTPTPFPTPSNVFGRLSTRAHVGSSDNILISGFSVTGSQSKKVLVRALGPSLTGASGQLANPTLELRDVGGALVDSNDDWVNSVDKQAIMDTTYQPPNDAESAIIHTLAPGNYIVFVRGFNNTTGVGLAEVIDLEATTSQLDNISSRAFAETGDNVMVGGFTIDGPQSQQVLIRGIGPSTGSPGALQDPTLELRDGNGNTLVFNNNWKDTQQTDITNTSKQPSDDRESAILATLVPGSYTAVLAGACGTSGVALVEVYNLGLAGNATSIPASSSLPVCHGSATWRDSPASGNWNTPPNWIPSVVPNGPADTATLAFSFFTALSISANTEVNGMVFNAGASSFTQTVNSGLVFTLSGAGITNNSGKTQNFVNIAGPSSRGRTVFTGNATAGSATNFTNNGRASSLPGVSGGRTEFAVSASAGSGVYVQNGATGSGSSGGGRVLFQGNSTAASGTFTNHGGTGGAVDGGGVSFVDGATPANASFTNNGSADNAASGFVQLVGSGTTGTALFTNNGASATGASGGTTLYGATADAGSATLVANSGSNGGLGGVIYFADDATGGSSIIKTFGNGYLDISFHNAPGVTIGSLEGNGNVFLGARSLSIGNNNASTTFSGVIQDGGDNGGVSGSLTKLGSGTLTLSGANTYTGGTAISGGLLLVNNTTGSGTGSGPVTVNSGATLGGNGIIAGAVTLTGTGELAPGDSPGVLTVNGNFTAASGAKLSCEINGNTAGSNYDQLIVGGTVDLSAQPSLNVTLGFTPNAGDQFILLRNTSNQAILGQFAGLPEQSAVSIGTTTFRVTYKGGAGNDFVLTALAAPTPTPTATPIPPPTATPISTATPTATPNPPNQPPTVQLTTTDNGGTTPPDGSKLNPGQSFTLSANAADDHAIPSVAFLVDGSVVGRTSTTPFQLTLSLLAAGDHTLMARATDDQGASTDSNTVTITILPAGGTTFTYQGNAGGAWTDPANWSPQGVPGPGDLAEVKNGQSVSVSGAIITVGSLTLGGNSGVEGNGTLTVNNNFTFSSGSLSTVHVIIPVGGTFALSGDGTKRFTGVRLDAAGLTNCSGAGAITGDSETTVANTGIFTIHSPSSDITTTTTATFGQFTNAGLVQIKGKLAADTYTQSGGQLDLQAYLDNGDIGPLGLAILLANTIQLDGGTVTGSGTFIGNVINNGASILPGHSAGSLSVQGNYTQGPNGLLSLEIGGTQPGQYDQLVVTGTAKLDGKLSVRTINDFTPDPASSFAPLQFGSVSGAFATTTSNAEVTITAGAVEVKVIGPNPPPPQAQNISTRLSVQRGDDVLIGGFIITGPAGSNKTVAVRGIGPSLSQFGVSNSLSDPFIELHKADGSVVTNDNWEDAPNANEVPEVLKPADDREAVLVASLPPGLYTAIVKDAHGESGVALAEVYDLDPPSTTALANISTRGLVQTADNVLIGGFIIGGTDPAKVLVRAIGPALKNFGVTNALNDPTLEVHDTNGAVIGNDDWRNTQEQDIAATKIPPTEEHEAAVLTTLSPGNYTAIVRGKNDTTGIALVEVYILQ